VSVFGGKRPMIGDTFNKNGESWEVASIAASIAANIGIVVAKKAGLSVSESPDHFIIIREQIK